MRILIVGAGLLLAATAAPALANGGAGRGGGHGGNAGASHGFGNSAWVTGLVRATYGHDWRRGYSRPGNHHGWFHGRHWGWFKPHNPHWPHEPPASP
jgi:hypothetical protein